MKLKPHYLGLCAMLISPLLPAADLTVAIDGYSSDTGYVMVSVFNDPTAFDSGGDAVILLKQVPVGQGHAVSFGGLPKGEYAVKLYHDENGNGELDRNVFGVPSENYGFSGISHNRGPATFEEAKFLVKEDTAIKLSLR